MNMSGPQPTTAITVYIDAYACPVKHEVYRVAEGHARKSVALKGFPYSVMAGLVPAINAQVIQ